MKKISSVFFASFFILLMCFLVVPNHLATASSGLKASAQYSRVAVAPGESVDINILINIEAPALPQKEKRLPLALSLVLDRSGSMSEAKKIDYARQAAKVVVNALEPDDLFALVIYDNEVNVLYPLGPVNNKEQLKKQIDGIEPRGMTFLSGGLEQGIAQLQKTGRDRPCRVMLLSDGLANQGISDSEMVAAIGANARGRGIAVSSIGLGLDFNENLMQQLAQRGGGKYYYIQDSKFLPAVFREELQLIEAPYTQNLRASFLASGPMNAFKVYGYGKETRGKLTSIEMGDFSANEKRHIMLNVKLTPKKAGKQKIGDFKLHYTDLTDKQSRDLLVPLYVEVVADESRRKQMENAQAADTKIVKEEVMLLEAEEIHVAAMEDLQKGNIAEAKRKIGQEQQKLAPAAARNKAIANKMEAMRQAEASLERAAASPVMQKEMSKAAKSSQYMSSLGKKQGIMLQAGDTGFMIEQLQKKLADKGLYAGKIDGIYGKEVEEAVKRFQKSQSMQEDGVVGPATRAALGL